MELLILIIAFAAVILVAEIASWSWNRQDKLEFHPDLLPETGLGFYRGIMIWVPISIAFWLVLWAVFAWGGDTN